MKKYTITKPTKYIYQLKECQDGIIYQHPNMPYIDLYNMLKKDTVKQKVKVFFELSKDYDEQCSHGKCTDKSHGFSFTVKEELETELGYHFCDIHGLEHIAIMNFKLREIQNIMYGDTNYQDELMPDNSNYIDGEWLPYSSRNWNGE